MRNPFKDHASLRDTIEMTKLLFLAQVRPFKKNMAVWLVCLGLLLLPPLYAWFNIASNWSPYDKTSNLQVAVTSLDKGVEIKGVKLNVGDKIVESLKGNDAIGWQFVSYDEGQKGVHSGKYYAALVIPKDFSEQITGFLNGNAETAQIDYYINEKLNAISAKIMGTGMGTVSSEIDKTFVGTITTVVLDSLKLADNEFAEYKPELLKMVDTMELTSENMKLLIADLDDFEKLLEQMETLTGDAEEVLPKASEALKDASDLTLSAQNTLQSSKSTVNDIERLLEQGVAGLNVYATQLDAMVDRLNNIESDDVASAQTQVQDIIDAHGKMEQHVKNLADNMERFNQMLPKPTSALENFVSKLDALGETLEINGDRLVELKKQLGEADGDISGALGEVSTVVNNSSSALTEAWNSYGKVSSSLSDSADKMNDTLDSTYKLLQDMSGLIPEVDSTLGTIRQVEPVGVNTLEAMKKILQSAQTSLEKQTDELKNLSEDEKVNKMVDFIQQDVEKQSAFISNPVEMKTNRVFPVENYGSGMSPFYTTLAIWVGCLLMMAMISPINEKGIEAYPEAWTTPMYLSRLMLYQIVSVFQSAIIALGDLFILKVDCMHPWLFVLLCILIGQIFSVFIFSLVFTFSAIGKAMAIVVLVLQIAASGGTFPTEMTPPLFQFIHPLLPFTYCIGAMREVCFGIYTPSLTQDLIVMASIPVISVALVVIFGPIMRKFVRLFESSMKDSGLM